MAGTTITPLTADEFAQRLAALFPNGWASQAAIMPGGVMYAIEKMLADPLAFNMTGLQYAANAMRLQTATGDALDLASLDFFGDGEYAIPRAAAESDDNYRATLLAALLPSGVTRQSISDAIKALTGLTPRMIEPWSPADTGVIDGVWSGNQLLGAMYLDVDTPATPARITDPLAYQGFIITILPAIQPIGNNAVPCMDDGIYLDVAGSSMFDFAYAYPQGESEIYGAVNRRKLEGTVSWVQFVPSNVLTWDSGLQWDTPGLVWG